MHFFAVTLEKQGYEKLEREREKNRIVCQAKAIQHCHAVNLKPLLFLS